MNQRRPHQSKRGTVLSATGSRTSEQSSTGPVDGIAYLRHRGYEIIRDNRYCLSAQHRGREVYRCIFDPGGGYFWRHVNGTVIGDSITLVCREEQIGLRDAIDRLASVSWSGRDRRLPVTAPDQRIGNGLRLPTDTEETHRAGQLYLHDQGISGAIMNHAEAQGALSYAAKAVVFVGYNEAFDVRSVTWWHYASAPVQKRIARGSDVSYPTVLRGDARLVWLVDEGLDGLALLTTLRAIGLPLPTVIVTNAAAGRQVLWRPHVQMLIKSAAMIFIVGARQTPTEPAEQAKIRYQQLHALVQGLAKRHCQTTFWWPDRGFRSIAEQVVRNYRQKSSARRL